MTNPCRLPTADGHPCTEPVVLDDPGPLCRDHLLDVALAVLAAGGPDSLDEPEERP